MDNRSDRPLESGAAADAPSAIPPAAHRRYDSGAGTRPDQSAAPVSEPPDVNHRKVLSV